MVPIADIFDGEPCRVRHIAQEWNLTEPRVPHPRAEQRHDCLTTCGIFHFTAVAGLAAPIVHSFTRVSNRIKSSRRKYARPAAVRTKGSGVARLVQRAGTKRTRPAWSR